MSNRLIKGIKNPKWLLNRTYYKIQSTLFRYLPDELLLKILYRQEMGESLNLKDPKKFSEKLQWLKLYNRRSEYTTMVDKYAVKKYIADKIGAEYIIPTLGVWKKPEDIDFDILPNSFVLKTTHGGGGGGVVICKDKIAFDKKIAIKKLNNSLKQDIYKTYREWPYKNVPKRIIAEQYVEPDSITNDLLDYKFFCFNGKPKLCQVIAGRESVMTIDFYDRYWNHQPFHEPKDTIFSSTPNKRPKNLNLMWSLAEKLAKDIPFIRVDFYEVNGKVFFGEITFFPTSGFGGFKPDEWDEKFGTWLRLPSYKNY